MGATAYHPNRVKASIGHPHGLEDELDHCLRALSHTHLRISLFAFRVYGIDGDAAVLALMRRGTGIGVAGTLPDGAVGVLYLGPRIAESHGGGNLFLHLLDRVQETLDHCFPDAGVAVTPAYSLHFWSDEVAGLDDLIRYLTHLPAGSPELPEVLPRTLRTPSGGPPEPRHLAKGRGRDGYAV